MMPIFHPERVQAVLFDLDGTLADTDDAYVRRLTSILRPVRFFHREINLLALARKLVMAAETPTNALLHLADRLSLDEVLGPFLAFLHRIRGETSRQDLSMIPGVRSALEALSTRYPLAVVTARERHTTMTFLDAHNLTPLFHCIATSRTCRQTKPHPAPIHWAAARMGMSPEACVMVGDTTTDIRAGVAAGTQTVGVLCGFGERDELERAGANLILKTTSELNEALLESS